MLGYPDQTQAKEGRITSKPDPPLNLTEQKRNQKAQTQQGPHQDPQQMSKKKKFEERFKEATDRFAQGRQLIRAVAEVIDKTTKTLMDRTQHTAQTCA